MEILTTTTTVSRIIKANITNTHQRHSVFTNKFSHRRNFFFFLLFIYVCKTEMYFLAPPHDILHKTPFAIHPFFYLAPVLLYNDPCNI